MPVYSRESLHQGKLPWIEIDDFEFFPLARGDLRSSGGPATQPYPTSRTFKPVAPRERLIVLAGEVQASSEGGNMTLKRSDWIDVPKEGLTIKNLTATQANLGHISGHWKETRHTTIALYGPDYPGLYHYHDCNEYWIVYRGNFTMKYDNREYSMHPGLMLATGTGHQHGAPAPEEVFEVVVLATGLEGLARPGLLFADTDGIPIPKRQVPASVTLAHLKSA